MAITLQFKINAGATQTGAAEVAAEDEIDLLLASYSGLRSIRYEIQEYPAGFPAPAGWSTDASSGAYYFNASSIAGLTPPTITMPTTAQIAAGQWGKWIFRAIGTTSRGTVITDPRCMAKIRSPMLDLNGIAFTEQNESNEQRAWPGDLHEDLVAIDGAALVSGGFVSSATATRPIKVSGSTGAVTWSWEPNATVGMLGYGFTACPSVVNAAGGLSLTAGAGAASLAGSTTATVSANGAALTLEGATDVAITAISDDVIITAADAITATATGALSCTGATAALTASGGDASVDASAVVKVGGTSATRVELGRSGQTVRHPALAGGGTRFVTVDNNGDEGASAATGAPADATYLVTSANGTLTNEVVTSALPSQLLFASSAAAPVVGVRAIGAAPDDLADVFEIEVAPTLPGEAGLGGGLLWTGRDGASAAAPLARIAPLVTSPTSGAHATTMHFYAVTAGSLTSAATLTGAGALAAVGSVTAGTGGFIGVSLDRATSGTLTIGGTNATAITSGAAGVTTTTYGLIAQNDSVGTGTTESIRAVNTTAADAVNTVRRGPVVASEGRAWRTSSGGASLTVRGGMQVRGRSGSSVGTDIFFVHDTGTGTYSNSFYYTTIDPAFFGTAVVASTYLISSGGAGLRFDNDGNGGLRKNGTGVQLTSGSTANVELATNSTVRLAIATTGAQTWTINDGVRVSENWGTTQSERRERSRVVTTSGTGTTVFTFATPASCSGHVRLRVTSADIVSGDTMEIVRWYKFKRRNSGATTLSTAVDVVALKDDPTWDCTADISGTDVVIRINCDASNQCESSVEADWFWNTYTPI